MSTQRRVLVVSQNPKVADTLVSWLTEAGLELSIVHTFAAAKAHLTTAPDLLITDLKLGEYNGLHLALRARSAGISSIVLGPEDPVLAKDAFELGASYLSKLPSRTRLIKIIDEALLAREQQPGQTEPASTNQVELMWSFFCDSPLGLINTLGRRPVLH